MKASACVWATLNHNQISQAHSPSLDRNKGEGINILLIVQIQEFVWLSGLN